MTNRELFVAATLMAVAMVVFPFMALLVAKLVSYGWASGRARFEREQQKRDGGSNGPRT